MKDAKELTAISIDAFHTDFTEAGRKTMGGPPGYDSIEFHKKMIKESTQFYKILIGSSIIGGFWFIQKNSKSAYLYRIFVDPKFHHKGAGLQAFEFLFQSIPNIKFWSLKAPVWNTRTLNFYKKVGFEITEKSDKFSFFAKTIEP
jgi:predicted acetyltransferase